MAMLRKTGIPAFMVVTIPYQQGLKDLVPASDLAEELLNNVDRPPAYSRDGSGLYAGKPLPHFNEVDECAGVDAVVTNRVWAAMGLDPATTQIVTTNDL